MLKLHCKLASRITLINLHILHLSYNHCLIIGNYRLPIYTQAGNSRPYHHEISRNYILVSCQQQLLYHISRIKILFIPNDHLNQIVFRPVLLHHKTSRAKYHTAIMLANLSQYIFRSNTAAALISVSSHTLSQPLRLKQNFSVK